MATIPDEPELLGMLMEADQSLPQVRVCEPYLNGEDSCQIFGPLLNLSPLLGMEPKEKHSELDLKALRLAFFLEPTNWAT